MDAHLDHRMLEGGNKPKLFELIEETRKRFATLVHADPDEIAFTKNVTEGPNMVATGLDWRAGDNVILCLELEHPNNIYPWLNLRRLGVEIRALPARAGAIPVEDMLARADGRTRVITASSVTFAPGYRTNLDVLGRACRETGDPVRRGCGPIRWCPRHRCPALLHRCPLGVDAKGAARPLRDYWDEHELVHPRSEACITCTDWEWAELDGKRLVWAAHGKLHAGKVRKGGLCGETELADFSGMTFEPIEAPYGQQA